MLTLPILLKHANLWALVDQSKTGEIKDVLLDHSIFDPSQHSFKAELARDGFNKYIQYLRDSGLDPSNLYSELLEKPIELEEESRRGY